jgi:hypothetical protein
MSVLGVDGLCPSKGSDPLPDAPTIVFDYMCQGTDPFDGQSCVDDLMPLSDKH